MRRLALATVTSPSTRHRLAAGLLVVALSGACQETAGPDSSVPAVEAIEVQAVSMAAVRVRWTPAGDADVISYRLERRANLTGAFEVVASSIPQANAAEVVYFDIGLEPDTYYGYRVIAQSRFGARAVPSLVRAARTPPRPAVLVTTGTILATPAAGDPDGYMAFLRGATDSASVPLGPHGEARFGPLNPGPYSVELRGIAGQCGLDGSQMRNASVTDQGIHTVDTVRYLVICRDPGLGRITVALDVSGDSLDASGYAVQIIGRPSAPGPDSIVSLHGHYDAVGGLRTYDLLRPGSYEVSIDSVAAHCVRAGTAVRSVTVAPLSDDTVRYAIACAGGGGGGAGPYVWRHAWSASTVPPGQRVSLDITLDLRANPSERVSTVQSVFRYNAAALRFDSAKTGGLGNGFVVNGATPGQVIWADFAFNPPGGLVTLTHLHFTAIGTAGATSTARSTIDQLLAGDEATALDTLVRFVEDTVTLGAGSGNQPPNAEAGGPYTGPAGSPIAFGAAGSSDPDGTIASYSWAFGDGGNATSAAPSHTYAAAGTYTATLTVTDNLGATDTDQATVIVSTVGGNQAPVGEANGPYSGTVNTSIAFSAAGSSDPDGTIASYSWTFGDGGSATGATPTHVYTVVGNYTAVLTVTDNQGATDADAATVTVTGVGQTTPFTWAGVFGTINPADSVVALTLTLDLTTDIVETPGGEELATWVVDSLKWNPAVLRYHAFNWGPGGAGVVNPTDALTQGKLVFSSFTLPASNNSGVIGLATIRFKVIGSHSSSTTTATTLGPLTGTVATGVYAYKPRTQVQEATLVVP